jgi:hypothetical protein
VQGVACAHTCTPLWSTFQMRAVISTEPAANRLPVQFQPTVCTCAHTTSHYIGFERTGNLTHDQSP